MYKSKKDKKRLSGKINPASEKTDHPHPASPPSSLKEGISSVTIWSTALFSIACWSTALFTSLLTLSILVTDFNGTITSHSITFSIALTLGLGLLAVSLGIKMPPSPPPSPWGWAAISLFLLFSFRVVFWSVTQSGGEYRCLLSNNLGDSCLHLSLINALSYGDSFWPPSPWFSSERLSYPPGPDMLDAMLVSLGHGDLESLRLTSSVLAVLTAVLLWAWGRTWGLVVFLLGGSWFSLASLLGVELSHSEQWKNLFLNVFSSQRGMQIALPVGLLVLISCRQFSQSGGTGYFYLASFLTVTLPFSSVHSLLAVFPVLFVTAVFGNFRQTLLPLSISLIGALLACWYIGAIGKVSSVRFETFLPIGEFFSPVTWMLNYGLWFPLIVWVSVVVLGEIKKDVSNRSLFALQWKTPDNWNRAVFLYFVALFLFASVVSVSPWTWDNTKLMLWSVVGTSSFIWMIFLKSVSLPYRSVFLALMVLPSASSVLKEVSLGNKGHRLFPTRDYHEALAAWKSFPPVKRLAASPEYNHPWLVAGHPFAVGYGGWLWSHGLKYKEEHRNLEKILRGDPGWEELCDKMGVTHLLWGEREKAAVRRKSHPVTTRWREVSRGSSGILFRRN